MSNILKRITGFKYRAQAAIDQRNTPVTDENLKACRFKCEGMQFIISDLCIWKIGNLFYYKSVKNKLIPLTNMFTVAQLVYGKIEYGR